MDFVMNVRRIITPKGNFHFVNESRLTPHESEPTALGTLSSAGCFLNCNSGIVKSSFNEPAEELANCLVRRFSTTNWTEYDIKEFLI
jgi:hypothetical protein